MAPGVFRIPLPLPSDALRAVNVYALVGGDELVLVDSGWALDEARLALEKALGSLGCELGEVARFLVTHVHRDHYTQAVALRRLVGNGISIGQGELPNLEVETKRGRPRLAAQLVLLERHGAPEIAAALAKWETTVPRDDPDWEMPDHLLVADEVINAGNRTLRAVETPGHTRGHLIFLDEAAGLCFAGDHVLPHITPSIGFEPAPVAHPLRDYLASLAAVRALPDARLLPAHGPVTESMHSRIDEILDHHSTRLADTERAVRSGASTAGEAAALLTWTRRSKNLADLDPFNQMLAVLEIASHLDVLVAQGRIATTTVEGTVHFWQP